jgi:phosphoribosylformylglycinamidine cyclo-ligase
MSKITYKDAGVDIKAGNEFVRAIKPVIKSTFRPEVLTDIGGFAGLFALKKDKYREPVLVSGTDGVGTKLKIAFEMGRHDTIGIDLVAMCVNDVAVTGAEPLFFLDYFASGRLDISKSKEVIKGIAEGCRLAGCALIGGETAEMPGFYKEGEYDLAGFAVGIVEKDEIIDGREIRPGDLIAGFSSSGLHSNGYSLARRVLFDIAGLKIGDKVKGLKASIGEEILAPTRIYAKNILSLRSNFKIKGIAHITGGGFIDNIPRILPQGCQAIIKEGSWKIPYIFDLIKEKGEIDQQEMYTDFNMGIGLILIIAREDGPSFVRQASLLGEKAAIIGNIEEGENKVVLARSN